MNDETPCRRWHWAQSPDPSFVLPASQEVAVSNHGPPEDHTAQGPDEGAEAPDEPEEER